ncbi:MAG: Zn-dependent exopeptidase M28 [Clostridia bacterium]|nr:Zn-dependent exopeptidase M28 [Clostridia bacterium]
MNSRTINKILSDTAYVRYDGTDGESRCAHYLRDFCGQMGLVARVEEYTFDTFTVETERLAVDGRELPCRGYLGAASGEVSAELYYLPDVGACSLKKCRGRIVLSDRPCSSWLYNTLVQNGAVGIITYNGDANMPDEDADTRRIGFDYDRASGIPVVNVHIKTALDLIRMQGKNCSISLSQSPVVATSQNVILDIPGENEEMIVLSAHYDSTALSVGAYDNMSGCIALLYIAERFAKRKNRFSIRFLWCGGEELGLLGSLEYCRAHKEELKKAVLNINLDMLGPIIGDFAAFSCADEKMEKALGAFLRRHRFVGDAHHQIRFSDSNSFVHFGVPAISFARYAPNSLTHTHTPYDRAEILSAEVLLKDMRIITAFVEDVQNNYERYAPIGISEKIKDDIARFMGARIYPKWLNNGEKNDK